ncbi:MAG: 2-C-methyl-D-erythritol 4-phosphate cytidylyltransferase [Lachnospiraceae bacterium]|jgi:2-C-methyl-D-erythritol 4-phosphate cytidylyltransferase|nr:2-C-methyl-D-erythritol 4-phosphate cytidylyltransferase [Lachnospiraceae bacterium]
MEKIWAVVPAAGIGKRMGMAVKKQFIRLKGKEILIRTLQTLAEVPEIEGILLMVSRDDLDLCQHLIHDHHIEKVKDILPGGSTRQESVLKGLSAIPKDCTMAVIHDGARPLVTRQQIKETIEAARKHGGALLAVPVKDTIKVANKKGFAVQTPPRSNLWSAQTPQAFRYPDILNAHRHAMVMGDYACTDDSQIVEKYLDLPVKIVQGSYENIKITTPEDISIGERILEARAAQNDGGAKA